MTMQAAVYGRIGQDPRSIETRSGNPMAVASIAVSLGEQGDPPLWVSVLGFGKIADEIMRHAKGDLISAAGRVQRNTWTTSSGEAREQLQVIADSVISARAVRPAGGKRKGGQPGPDLSDDDRAPNDEVPF